MEDNAEDRLALLLKKSLEQIGVNTAFVKVCRKTKNLDQGDFFVPKNVFDLKSETGKTAQLETLIQEATSGDVLPIAHVKEDKQGSIVFHVDRQKAFTSIVHAVLTEGEAYGCQVKPGNEKVVVNPVDVMSCVGEEGSECVTPSLTQLRAVMLLKHVLALLSANGYQARSAKIPITDDMQELVGVLNSDIRACEKSATEELCGQLTLRAGSSAYCEILKLHSGTGHKSSGGGVKSSGDGEKADIVVVSLRRFMTDANLPVGKSGFDKNLNLLDVRLEDGTLSDTVRKAAVVELISAERGVAGEKAGVETGGSLGEGPVRCLHLVSQSLAYTQQQAHLLWQMCSPDTTSAAARLTQHHLVFGTISGRKTSASAAMDAKEFYNVRHRQMTQAAMMKYGDHDQGDLWDDMVHSLTMASVTFDLLTTACPSQVHVDLSEEEGDNRSGPFVLYNCARLASLLHAFQQHVEQGTYPPLPDPQQVDFRLLREEEEWTIALLYLNAFPRLVQDTVTNWATQGVSVCIHTHKISHFLLSFCKTLSSYYSRYHILGGSEPHLLPVMYARLSLMKAAHQVLCNGLRLLGLQPLTRL